MMDEFDFKKFWRGLDAAERIAFAADAGTTVGYIQTYLARGAKIPGKALMHGIYAALRSRQVLKDEKQLLAFFYAK